MNSAWSFLYDEMYGPDDEKNYVEWKKNQEGKDSDYELTADGFVWPKVNDLPPTYIDELYSNKKMVEHSKYYYDYDRNDPNRKAPDGIVGSGGTDFISSNIALADGYSVSDATEEDFNDFWHGSNPTGYEMDYTKLEGYDLQIDVPDLPATPDNNNGRWKYHEDVILKDIHEYVSGTYRSHYTGKTNGFADIQTIDLMAAKGLASGFCQSNIIKYGTRYGDKDGQNKKDLLKVIHYAMLLLHFDDHYKPTNSDFPY